MRKFKMQLKDSDQFCTVVNKIMKDNNFQDKSIHRFSDKPFLYIDLDMPTAAMRILFINLKSSFDAETVPEISADDFLAGKYDNLPDNRNPHRDMMLWWVESINNHVEVQCGTNTWMSASNPSWLPTDVFRRKPEVEDSERMNAEFIRARAHDRYREIQILDGGVWVDLPSDDRIYASGQYRFTDPLNIEVERILANAELVARLKDLI